MDSLGYGTESPDSPAFIPGENAGGRSATKSSDKKKKIPARRRREEEEWEAKPEAGWHRKGRSGGAVMLEGYVDVAGGVNTGPEGGSDLVGRTKSLTDEDLEELKGCLDLGFGFAYEEIPELCNTLPALELCYSMSQKFLDEQQQRNSGDGVGYAGEVSGAATPAPSTPIANWKISNPGDHPDDVKARLKYWAQAVACTVRLCS
ncbi:hypothetical protein KSP39_PZI006159 [Platanthera zijinensis]|uniref:Uncharacterized protein n=1 Tax=Platanthera zijinensis TaxID=2320716 RepID=A0AAP0BT81_9ASPA